MKQKPQETGFKKEIGLFGGMSVICGIMIGSGIFYLGSYVLQRSGYSLGLALICWLVGGACVPCSAGCASRSWAHRIPRQAASSST